MRRARLDFLLQKGWLGDGISELDETLRNRLRAMELRRTSEALAAATGRGSFELAQGERFEGRFEKAIDLGQGRLALIGNAREFALVPWRPEMERHRGREMTVTPTARGVSWTIGIGRGLGR